MNPYSATSRSWITAAFIRTSARSIASTSGANSSITLARDRPFGDRRGGVAGPGDDRYFRTVLRSRPVSRAISDRLSFPDSNSPRKRRSSNQRSASKSIAMPLSAATPTSSRVPKQHASPQQQLSPFIRTKLGT